MPNKEVVNLSARDLAFMIGSDYDKTEFRDCTQVGGSDGSFEAEIQRAKAAQDLANGLSPDQRGP